MNTTKNIELIKALYKGIEGKTKFKIHLADKLDKSPATINNHWLSTFWAIPLEYQESVINELKNWKNETMAQQFRR